MKKIKQNDKRKRKKIFFFEIKKLVLKSIIKNDLLINTVKWNAIQTLSLLEKNSSKVRIVNFCIETGRKKKINKLFNFSRLSFLKLARSGIIPGLIKSSW